MREADTIVAIATPPGRGAIGVVRLSGPSLSAIFRPLLARDTLPPRHATFLSFLDADGLPLDEGLAIYFPAPHSYTGEDVLELQGHGGPAVLALVLRRCVQLGARLAEPGEFTRRAFLNERMDLVQAEAVADLIGAGSEAAVRSAVRSLEGEFSRRIHDLVQQLIDLRVLVEACIDFPEEDVELLGERGGYERLERLRNQFADITAAARSGRMLQEGARVVLCGQPNVGKSTLLNRLAGSEVAIVTDVPGTTRDPLREIIQIDGVPVQIIDTAGLRPTVDTVERLGVERTWLNLRDADLAVLLVDARTGVTVDDCEIRDALPALLPLIVVANKRDLGASASLQDECLSISALDGTGVDDLKQRILKEIGWQPPEAGVYAARERHVRALEAAAAYVEAAATQRKALELFAEELRLAQEALRSITGEFSADDLLGEIFGRFCIGK
jgi:tRNA modification GTPase